MTISKTKLSKIIGATSVLGIGAIAALYIACLPNPDIDGSSVPPIGSDASAPECAPLCERLARLCGYAPVGCVSRCEAEFAEEQRVCIGQAPSCRAALQDCTPAEAEPDDAGEDAEEDASEAEEDASTEDAGDSEAPDAGDAASDASSDAPTEGG